MRLRGGSNLQVAQRHHDAPMLPTSEFPASNQTRWMGKPGNRETKDRVSMGAATTQGDNNAR